MVRCSVPPGASPVQHAACSALRKFPPPVPSVQISPRELLMNRFAALTPPSLCSRSMQPRLAEPARASAPSAGARAVDGPKLVRQNRWPREQRRRTGAVEEEGLLAQLADEVRAARVAQLHRAEDAGDRDLASPDDSAG